MRDFRVVPASTGHVVQCDCGWYAPLWDRDPKTLAREHAAEWHQRGVESPDPTDDTRKSAYASQIDVGAVRNGMSTGAGEPQ